MSGEKFYEYEADRDAIYAASSRGYVWAPHLVPTDTDLEPICDSYVPPAGQTGRRTRLLLSSLTYEYFPLGVAWARIVEGVGVRNYLFLSMDEETHEGLIRHGIPSLRVHLPTRFISGASEKNPGGFGAKAMGVIYCRTRIVARLLASGVDVVCCDVDAIPLQDPLVVLNGNAAISFQRVSHFPKPLSSLWGFTACGGFIAFRSMPKVNRFLAEVLKLQLNVSSDQLSFNLAMLDAGVMWDRPQRKFTSRDEVVAEFVNGAPSEILGVLTRPMLSVRALPADRYWRHEYVPKATSNCALLHPNSPKDLLQKIPVLRDHLGGEASDRFEAGISEAEEWQRRR